MSKRTIENRLDELESESDDRLSMAEYWLRDIDDSLEDPTEPWEEWFKGVDQ
ncbi:hypothetical protein [Natrialba sp. INN-245]|uniref:hypothetical protein n=1 Tax=Natrialba sp. INN-245 TaxID=2690967 RepID=UPI0013124D60|nr:hypothetical protein [Natrialba sp. INN-245]MWV40130.1 hypothetical protein [Natrialba sp. INN-245]